MCLSLCTHLTMLFSPHTFPGADPELLGCSSEEQVLTLCIFPSALKITMEPWTCSAVQMTYLQGVMEKTSPLLQDSLW